MVVAIEIRLETFQAAYAVVELTASDWKTVASDMVTQSPSAQKAELTAVLEALKLSKDQIVNIYTDSAYAHGVIHWELAKWLRAGFVTAIGQPIKHEGVVQEIAKALMMPKKVAVVKCKGHDSTGSMIAIGNAQADLAAKETAGYTSEAQQMLQSSVPIPPNNSLTRAD